MARNARITMTRSFNISWVTGMTLLFLAIALLLSARPVAAQQSLYADITAFRVGDALTIQLAERTSAQRKSGWERSTSSNLGGAGNVNGADNISGSFGVNATFNNQAQKENESVQRDLLQGTMTALVVGVDSLAGNLIIEGERSLHVNGETHILKVQGSVRPFDVSRNNTILSYQLANAIIEYKKAGGIKRALMGPGALAGVATLLVVGAAIAVGSN